MADESARGEESDAERLRRQLSALSRFGGHALRSDDLDSLLAEATELVSEALDVELVKVLELLPDGDTMLVRAGVNWRPGVVGQVTFSAHEHSPGGALLMDEPVISNDVASETRFTIPQVLREHGVKSMINVVIKGETPWGVLEVDAPRRRRFDEDDVAFLQNYANLLAAAIGRLRTSCSLGETAARNEILLSELRHRVLNMLANIRAVAARTRATSSSLDQFATAFDARLAALTRTQRLLTEETEEGIGIRRLLSQELEALGAGEGGRVTLEGPSTSLPPRIVQALSMGFHELATNAGKHGALGRDGGRLEVSWTKEPSEDGAVLLIRWRETGGPLEGRPERRGLGSAMIEEGLPFMIGGSCELIFHRDGLECAIRCPLPDEEAR
ncbi:MAG: HWE histidine kinase domain-containing protein [Tistlia sp.]